jgi:transposase
LTKDAWEAGFELLTLHKGRGIRSRAVAKRAAVYPQLADVFSRRGARGWFGRKPDEVAELSQVGRASVNRLVRRYRKTGSVAPSPHGGGKPRKLTSRGEKVLRGLVEERSDATIPEFVRLMGERAKPTLSTTRQYGNQVVMSISSGEFFAHGRCAGASA